MMTQSIYTAFLPGAGQWLLTAVMRMVKAITRQDQMSAKERTFQELTARYSRIIGRICLSFARSGEDYEDLRQDVLANIWNGLDKFRSDCSASTWIYRVALNTCVSFQRKASRRDEMSVQDLYLELYDNSSAQDIERYRMMYEFIGRLRPIDKSVLLMWLDGNSYEEIAQVVGLSRYAVAGRIKRAKDSLAEMYNKENKL